MHLPPNRKIDLTRHRVGMNIEELKARIAAIDPSDPEIAHNDQDSIWEDVLRHIAEHSGDAHTRELAAEALKIGCEFTVEQVIEQYVTNRPTEEKPPENKLRAALNFVKKWDQYIDDSLREPVDGEDQEKRAQVLKEWEALREMVRGSALHERAGK